MADTPNVRIGTAEREQALADLSRHFTAGRLSVTEFDERSASVAAATTRAELSTAFADLPPLVPRGAPPPATGRRGWDWRASLTALTPIVAVALFFTLHDWWYFLLIPAVPAVLKAGRAALPPARPPARGGQGEVESK
jgi:hypothetical protein